MKQVIADSTAVVQRGKIRYSSQTHIEPKT